MRRAIFVMLAVGLLLGAKSEKKDAAKKELEKFTGTWMGTSAEHDGKELPKEQVEKMKLEVKGKDYTFHMGDQVVKGTHKVDPTKSPKQIDAVRSEGEHAGEAMKGIYTLDAETFKVCFGEPGKDRPTELSTTSGGGHRLLTFKRAKP